MAGLSRVDAHDRAGPGLGAAAARSLVAGETLSGLQRVVLVGDSASGISAELDWDAWSFLNVDLDVHLSRPSTASGC